MKKKIRTLLINPPQTFYPGSQKFSKSFPLGIAYIGAVLEKEGYRVEILDTLTNSFEATEKNGIKHYGMSWKSIEKEIRNRRPNIVGITCPFTAQIENAVEISKIVKEIDPEILTVIGGPDSSVRASTILKEVKTIDIAAVGEGEYTMLELVAKKEKGVLLDEIDKISGIAFRNDNEVVLNPMRDFIVNLDELPLPAYHLFDMECYLDKLDDDLYATRFKMKKRELPLITSRGCPYDCIFCSIHLHMGKKWRAHSAGKILDHLSHLTRRYGIEHIHFEDDNFTLNPDRTHAILNGIIDRKIKITWDTPNGVRADKFTKNMLLKMKKTGCVNLTIGIESGDQTVLNDIVGKRLNLTDVKMTAKECQEIGIPLYAFFVLGFPGEKIENMERSVAFAEMLSESYGVNNIFLIATPLYGTRLYKICKDKGFLVKELTPRTLSEGTQINGNSLIKTDDFGPEDIKDIIDKYTKNETKRKQERYIEGIYKRFGRFGKLGRFFAAFYLSSLGLRLRAIYRSIMRMTVKQR